MRIQTHNNQLDLATESVDAAIRFGNGAWQRERSLPLEVQAAMAGAGVALAPSAMFRRELASGRLVRPFTIEIDVGRYWLTRTLGREPSPDSGKVCIRPAMSCLPDVDLAETT